MTADICISTASKKAATSHLVRVLPGVAFALAADAVAAVVAQRRRRVVRTTSGLLWKDKQNVEFFLTKFICSHEGTIPMLMLTFLSHFLPL